jgi:hypothetical protein
MFSFAFNSQSVECAYPYIKETLPKSYLGYGTNNQYPLFPPKMSDGRSIISSWNPESAVNHKFKEEQTMYSSNNPNWFYREYLQKNGYKIMEKNYYETANDTGGYIPNKSKEVQSSLSERNSSNWFDSYGDTTKPKGYQDSDLKELYLTREQLNARKVAPTYTIPKL